MSGVVKSFLGVSACAGTAALLSAFLRDYDGEMKLAVPVVCLMAVTATSVLVGRVPGFFGSLAATLFLTFFLFAPTGSLAVSDPHSRVVLFLTQIAAILVVLLTPSGNSVGARTRR
jgi:K+-sensing histidine kinase KdpD